jgi:hypothetical protein
VPETFDNLDINHNNNPAINTNEGSKSINTNTISTSVP